MAVLTNAVFRLANLAGVDLTEADLRGADFRQADLRRADLSKTNLTSAISATQTSRRHA